MVMRWWRLTSAVGLLVLSGCGGDIVEQLVPEPFVATQVAAQVPLSATPSFADERGGGLFIDLAGRVVRLRVDGSKAPLESHPQNPTLPGPATSVWPLGPFNALVVTTRGLFVADAGWLIAPPWQTRLDAEGFIASASGPDGSAWVAHRDGLFRLDGGQLTELKAGGASITGVTALAVAPAGDLRPGVWFAQGTTLSVAAQTGKDQFTIRDSGLTADDLRGGVRGLAGLGPSPTSAGEVWVITPTLVLQRTLVTWRRFEVGRAPRQLLAAGRFLWLRAGDGLLRYDGDAKRWGAARGLDAVPTLLSADAAGAAWVRVGEASLMVTPGPTPRVKGIFQNQTITEPEALLTAVFPTSVALDSLTWRFDDGQPRTVDLKQGVAPQQGLVSYSLAGVEPSGRQRVVSFAALDDGRHTLEVTAKTVDGVESKRAVHLDFEASASVRVSFVADIKPLAAARCDKCHTTGTEPELSTLAQWREFAAAASTAVRDRRMPADGPMDAASIQLLARWASGGTLP